MIEGLMVAVSGRRPEELKAEDYLELLRRLQFQPRHRTVRGLLGIATPSALLTRARS